MVYHGTNVSEYIQFHIVGEPNQIHWIEMIRCANKPTFIVTCCCDPEWGYEFYMEGNSDYERVKMTIMDAIMDCECIDELLTELSSDFEDGFSDIIVEDGYDFDCENCEYMN